MFGISTPRISASTKACDRLCSIVLLFLVHLAAAFAQAPYNPLRTDSGSAVTTYDVTVHDAGRDRDIPIRVYFPETSSDAPVVVFSHGLGGSREMYSYLGKHWAARGFVAVFLQHPGSDDAVWKNTPKVLRMRAMRKAASVRNFLLRVEDVPAVLDQLEKWNEQPDHRLHGRLDMHHVGMSGHSFGALTTQAVGGQRMADGRRDFTDSRIIAAIALSPSIPKRGKPEEAFGGITIPWMLMTGTEDAGIIGDATPESRMAVFESLPRGNKSELILENAEHSAFSDRALPGDTEPRNPNHHRAVLAFSTAFWETYLKGDTAAAQWLDGSSWRTVLEPGDRWLKK